MTTPDPPSRVPPVTPAQEAALHRLAASLRRTIELAMVTDAPEADILAAAEAADALAERLEAAPRHRNLWRYAEPPDPREASVVGPVIGMANPLTAPYRVTLDGGDVVMTTTLGTAYEGPRGCVHGGHVACLFDEVLGMAQFSTGQGGMTGSLTIKYRAPTPLFQPLTFRCRITRIEGRKLFAEGTLHAGDLLCAEATGLFIGFTPAMREAMSGRYAAEGANEGPATSR
jgi:acyl-coenzyme A thioesterase PaaI-like protein